MTLILKSQYVRILFMAACFACVAKPISIAGSQNEPQAQIPNALIDFNPDAGTSKYFFIVDKSARELSVWSPNQNSYSLVKKVPADIGKNNSNKMKQGDHATPEGIYWLESRLDGPSLDFSQYGSLAFTTSYPNVFDKVADKTGYGIWLHAVPDVVPLTRGSRGCVVVRNDVIKDLSQYITLGTTPIMIFNKVEMMSNEERNAKKIKINAFLNSWKSAWIQKNIPAYIQFYHDRFKSMGMNKNQWEKHKTKLAHNYQDIQIELSPASIFSSNSEWVIRMIQNYKSDKYQDSGYKTLYVTEQNGEFKIVAEEFQKITTTLDALVLKTAAESSMTSPTN